MGGLIWWVDWQMVALWIMGSYTRAILDFCPGGGFSASQADDWVGAVDKDMAELLAFATLFDGEWVPGLSRDRALVLISVSVTVIREEVHV